MLSAFAVAGGSIIGTEHRRIDRPNQDTFAWRQTEELTIAVVGDGCGSSPYSHLGAQLAMPYLFSAIERRWQIFHQRSRWHRLLQPHWLSWPDVQQDIKAGLNNLLSDLDGSLVERVQAYGLFTLVGAVITPDETITFSFGDGVIALNGQITTIGPFPDNAPPYLGYALLDQNQVTLPGDLLRFQVHHEILTADVHSLLLGTDGVVALMAAERRPRPGQTKLVGPLQQFWEDPWFVQNPDAIRRTLSQINRPVVAADWAERTLRHEAGLLPDDTTIVVIRRREDS